MTTSVVLFVASVAYQSYTARKQKKKAKREAEKNKNSGFDLVFDGEVSAVPIAYGRCKIGGIRVYSYTSNDFIYTSPNSDISFHPGFWLNDTITGGDSNEFLYTDQVLCQGPIGFVANLVIDDSRYLEDYTLIFANNDIRSDVYYDGGSVSEIIAANDPIRDTATFTGVAHAAMVFRTDEDKPAFGGVPDVAYFLFGKKVRTVVSGVLGVTYAYSSNPAWILLDYLLEYTNISESQIDLDSFETVATTCDQIVKPNATVGGKIWGAIYGTAPARRDIPLYECNIVLDSANTIRENVEAILGTMGDARLIWSAGQYKLSMQYPGVDNVDMVVAAEITDDEIVLSEDANVEWPDSNDRLNFVTIRFRNESENFKEDTISWPDKTTGIIWQGVDGKVYEQVSGWDDSEAGQFLNNHGVWDGTASTTNMSWTFRPTVSGIYTLKFTVDDSGTITIGASNYVKSTAWTSILEDTINLNANTNYTISISGTDTGGERKGVAGKLINPSGKLAWSTRHDSYSTYEQVTKDATVYGQMLVEDNNIELEANIFVDGISDAYHAKAKAEEMVRTSRTAFKIELTVLIKDVYFEPGDVIKLNSQTLKLGTSSDLFIKLDRVDIQENNTAKLFGTRFDWTQLAWNVNDNEYLKPESAYNFQTSSLFSTRGQIYRQDTEPTTPVEGDIWIDTSTIPIIQYVYLGGTWQISSTVAAMFLEPYFAEDYVTNSQIYSQETEPLSPIEGDIWIDTSVIPSVQYVYTDGAWIESNNVSIDYTGVPHEIASSVVGQISSGNIATYVKALAVDTLYVAQGSVTSITVATTINGFIYVSDTPTVIATLVIEMPEFSTGIYFSASFAHGGSGADGALVTYIRKSTDTTNPPTNPFGQVVTLAPNNSTASHIVTGYDPTPDIGTNTYELIGYSGPSWYPTYLASTIYVNPGTFVGQGAKR